MGVTSQALLVFAPVELAVRTVLAWQRRARWLSIWLRRNRFKVAGSVVAFVLSTYAWLRRLRSRFLALVEERQRSLPANAATGVALPPASDLSAEGGSTRRPQVVVLGGGVAGLSAAWRVAEGAPQADV